MRRALTVAALGASAWLIWSARAESPERVAEALEALPPPAAPGTLILDLEDDASEGDIQDFAERYGLELAYTSEVSRDEALLRAEVTDLAAAVAAVSGDPLVEVAEPAVTFEAYGYPNDPMWEKQWNMKMIDAPTGWRVGGGDGVIVAVIDTGVAPVEDLEGVTLLEGRSFVPGASTATDDHGHGTHVAGTIAQATNNGVGVAGVASEVTVLPYKVLSRYGSGASDWVAAAVDDAVDQGADVINLSLGGPRSKVLEKAVAAAVEAGVVVVAAAGNTGKEGVGCPANVAGVVGVSAVGPDDTLTWYSTWGEGVEISAPGGDLKKGADGGVLQDTIDGKGGHAYLGLQGTSMATPHVAGAAAVLRGMGLDADATVDTLLDTAADRGDEGWDKKYGHGRLDLGAAVQSVLIEQRGLLFLVGGLLAGSLAWLARLRLFAAATTVAAGAVTAGGLFFLPLIPGLAPSAWMDVAWRGLLFLPAAFAGPEWVHFPLWASALLPATLAFVLGPTRTFGPLVAGVCAGFGATLLHGAAAGTIDPWWMSWGLDQAWLSINGTACLIGAMAVVGVQKTLQSEGR